MKRSFLILSLFVTCFILYPPYLRAQQPQAPPDMNIDAATRSAVIEVLLRELNDGYVFPDMARKTEADVKARIAAKEYENITSAQAFAKKLTDDLQSLSKDKHLRVRYSAQPIPVRKERGEPTAAEKEQSQWFSRRVNYGFEKIERMNGNIGYIDLRNFSDHEAGAETVAAAMRFLANTESLIFDLRQNGGGNPYMIALISSYLFGDKPVHLNDLYWRKENKTDEFWTKPESAKIKFTDKDIYVLTSNYTFSGAEEFTYNLKNLKRATIIGETTGGGAHPGGGFRISEHFGMFVPTGRAISPITKTNWEGTGVTPDVAVPADQALHVARIAALKKSLTTLNPDFKSAADEEIQKLEKELAAMKSKS